MIDVLLFALMRVLHGLGLLVVVSAVMAAFYVVYSVLALNLMVGLGVAAIVIISYCIGMFLDD